MLRGSGIQDTPLADPNSLSRQAFPASARVGGAAEFGGVPRCAQNPCKRLFPDRL